MIWKMFTQLALRYLSSVKKASIRVTELDCLFAVLDMNWKI